MGSRFFGVKAFINNGMQIAEKTNIMIKKILYCVNILRIFNFWGKSTKTFKLVYFTSVISIINKAFIPLK
jgi:ABC-type proline/glycine betaine transport system permease subunit